MAKVKDIKEYKTIEMEEAMRLLEQERIAG